MSKNKIKQEKAITLIALVVSIIVLLILAGVSIAVLTGQNGILNRATSAKQTNEQKTAEEELKLGVSALSIDYRKNTTNPQTFREFVVSNTGLTELKKAMGLSADNQELIVEDAANGILSYKGQKYQVSDFGGVGEYEPTEEELAMESNGIEVITSSNSDLNDKNKIRMVLTGDVPIPVNATYITGTKSTGIVIEYKGSEFVWVPVPVAVKTGSELVGTTGPKPMAKVSTAEGYASGDNTNQNYEGVLYVFSGSGSDVASKEMTTYGQHATNKNQTREPDIVTSYDNTSYNYLKDIGFVNNNQSDPDGFLETLISDYKKMVESVAKYGGFYVGRYETSIDSETVVASKKSPDATSIKPMTAADNDQMWYGMYDKQKKFSTTGLQSSMIWGSQYDAMLNWMITGTEKAKVMESNHGNHQGWSANVVGCGTYNNNDVYDVINNIYDLEGNAYEWTLEANSTVVRVNRGGDYRFAGAPSNRYTNEPNGASSFYGSRLSLYIK